MQLILCRSIGKVNIQWPGLNAPVAQGRDIGTIVERPVDPLREQRLMEVRNRLDRFRRLSIPPSERGFTGGSPAGKSLGVPNPIDESTYTQAAPHPPSLTRFVAVTFENFDSRLVEFKTLQRTIGKIGRKKFTSAFVAVGNGQGLVGAYALRTSITDGNVSRPRLCQSIDTRCSAMPSESEDDGLAAITLRAYLRWAHALS